MSVRTQPDEPLRRLLAHYIEGAGPSVDQLLEQLEHELLARELAPEELELARDVAVSADPRPLVDELVQLRVRRALESVCGRPANVILARGDEPQGDETTEASEDMLARTRAGRLAQSLSISLGLDRRAGPRPDGRELIDQGALVLTDPAGRRELERSLGPSVLSFHSDHVTRVAASTGSAPTASAEDRPAASTVGSLTLSAVDCGGMLDEIEKVVLWSISSHEDNTKWRESFGSLVGMELGGKYLIEKKVGQGGFGAVYRARDKVLGALVAVKVLHPGFSRRREALEGFLAEAQRLTALDHPNIVRWITFDRTADGLHYFVMEFLDGEELEGLMRRERVLEPQRCARLLLQILDALRRAHNLQEGCSLLHLDLKPQNVYVLPQTAVEQERVKVIDFGISRFSSDDGITLSRLPARHAHLDRKVVGKNGKTVQRVAGGSVLYASPEQCKHIVGDEDIEELDGRSDLYSLGIIAFKMLTGEWPYRRPATEVEAIKNHLMVAPKRVHDLRRQVPRKLAAFVDRCLEKDREARWGSAEEAYQALNRIVNPVLSARRFAAILVALLALAAAVIYAGTRPPEPRDVEFQLAGEARSLRDRVVKIRAGTQGVELTANEVDLQRAAELRLEVVQTGELAQGFELAVSESGDSLNLTCADPQLAARDEVWSELVHLVWSQDGVPHRSPVFQLTCVPPLGLVAPEIADGVLLSLPGLPNALSGERPILVDDTLSLLLSLDDPHEVLDEESAVFVEHLDDGVFGEELLFEPRGRGGFPVYRLPLTKLMELDERQQGADVVHVLGHVLVRDEFGDEERVQPDVDLRLTRRPTRLPTLEIGSEFEGRGVPALPRGGGHFLYRDAAQASATDLVISGVLEAGRRSEQGFVVTADGGEPLPVAVETGTDGRFELRISYSALGERENPTLEVHFEEELESREAGAVQDRRKLQLYFQELPSFDVSVGSERLGSSPALVRSGERRLIVSEAPRGAVWAVRLLTPGSTETWSRIESEEVEIPLLVEAQVGSEAQSVDAPGAFAFELEFYDAERLEPGSALEELANGDPLIARTYSLLVDDTLELVARDEQGDVWSGASVGSDGGGLVRVTSAGGAPLAEVCAELWRNEERLAKRVVTASEGLAQFSPLSLLAGDAPDQLDGTVQTLEDGSYRLALAGRDELGNASDEFEVAFEINTAGPRITCQLPDKNWTDRGGRYSVEARAQDGNGIELDSLRVTVRDREGRWEIGPLVMSQQGKMQTASSGMPVEAQFQVFVPLEPEHSGSEVQLEIAARDLDQELGRETSVTRLAEVRHHYESPVTVGTRDPVPMILVQPEGSYVLAEYNLEIRSEREEFRKQLRELGVHYTVEPDFGSYTRGLASEAPPETRVPAEDLAPYYLDEHEVSRRQFADFLEHPQGFAAVDWLALGHPDYPAGARLAHLAEQCSRDLGLPIEGVTWFEAFAYAAWAGKRLPTYLEWELAVRGSDRQRFFAELSGQRLEVPGPGGQEQSAMVYAHIGAGSALGVMQGHDRSPLGLWHLCGNVAEWTATLRGPGGAIELEPILPDGASLLAEQFWIVGADYALRSTAGGRSSWPEHDYRSTQPWRGADNIEEPQRGMPLVGFRCAIDARLVPDAR